MLRTFLPSVVRYSEEDGACVYVADNGSTDASVQMLREEFPMVRLILTTFLAASAVLPTDRQDRRRSRGTVIFSGRQYRTSTPGGTPTPRRS